MAYSAATFEQLIDDKKYVQAVEYAAIWQNGADMDQALDLLASRSDVKGCTECFGGTPTDISG